MTDLALLALPFAAMLGLEAGYDMLRYGTPVGFPNYHLPRQNVVMAEGRISWTVGNVFQYLLSPNQGVPWYSPVALASLLCWRRPGMGAWLFLAALAPLGLFYMLAWGVSSWAWGLRYSYVFLPALVLPAAFAWDHGGARRAACAALAGAGLAVQLLAIVPNPLTLYEREIARHPGLRILTLVQDPAHAPLLLAWRDDPVLLAGGLAAWQHRGGRPAAHGLREAGARLPDVWWCLVLLEPVPRGLVLAVMALLVAGGGYAARRLARMV